MDVSMLSERARPLMYHMEHEGYSQHGTEMMISDSLYD